MSIKRKTRKSYLTIPCLYIKNEFTNCRIPITAITYVEFLGNNLEKKVSEDFEGGIDSLFSMV